MRSARRWDYAIGAAKARVVAERGPKRLPETG